MIFGTYNLFNLSAPRTAGEKARYAQIIDVMRGMVDSGADCLAVQEVLGDTPEEAGRLLRQVADDTGLDCMTAPNPATGQPAQPAIAASQQGHPDKDGVFRGNYHVGLLWNPAIKPVPGGWRAYNGMPDFWHALATLNLDFGGTQIKCGSFHHDPFRPNWRYNESRRVTSAFIGQLGMVGMDANGVSADRTRSGELYDHDPYTEQDHDMLEYQIRWRTDPTEPPVADRDAAELMRRQGLLDTAPLAETPWEPTTGHLLGPDGKADPFGLRRIDIIRVTRPLAPTVRSHRTIRTATSLKASDHLPVLAEVSLDSFKRRDA